MNILAKGFRRKLRWVGQLSLVAALVSAAFAPDAAQAFPLLSNRVTVGTTATFPLHAVAGHACPEPCPDCTDCIPEIEITPSHAAQDDLIAREIERLGPPPADPCDPYVERSRVRRNVGACGIRCWYWRLRHGYCGPGCEYYRYRLRRDDGHGGPRHPRYACRS